jgi:hypothetical protein
MVLTFSVVLPRVVQPNCILIKVTTLDFCVDDSIVLNAKHTIFRVLQDKLHGSLSNKISVVLL